MSFNYKPNPHGAYVCHWAKDHACLLKEFVPEDKIHAIKMPEELWADENWQTWERNLSYRVTKDTYLSERETEK